MNFELSLHSNVLGTSSYNWIGLDWRCLLSQFKQSSPTEEWYCGGEAETIFVDHWTREIQPLICKQAQHVKTIIEISMFLRENAWVDVSSSAVQKREWSSWQAQSRQMRLQSVSQLSLHKVKREETRWRHLKTQRGSGRWIVGCECCFKCFYLRWYNTISSRPGVSKPSSGRVFWSIFSLASRPNGNDAGSQLKVRPFQRLSTVWELHDRPPLPGISRRFPGCPTLPTSENQYHRPGSWCLRKVVASTEHSFQARQHWNSAEGYPEDELDRCHAGDIAHQLQSRVGHASSCKQFVGRWARALDLRYFCIHKDTTHSRRGNRTLYAHHAVKVTKSSHA